MRSAARVLGLLPTAAAATLAVALVSAREPATHPVASSAQSKPAARVEIIRNREITELAYPSSDGRRIPAALSMPRGDGPLPIVVTIHGGQGNRDLAFIRTPDQPPLSEISAQARAVLLSTRATPRGLLATRTIEVSPFPEDKGRVLYCGDFDCANIESHNTAWIYRGTLPGTKKNRP